MDWTEVLALGGVSAPSRPGVPDIACWARCPDQGHPRSRSARTPPWSPTPRLSPTDPGDPCPGLTSSSTSTLDWSLCTSSLTSLSAPGEGSCGVREACSPPCAPHPGPASRPHAGGLPVWGLALGTKFSPSSCRVSPAPAPPSSRASPAPAPGGQGLRRAQGGLGRRPRVRALRAGLLTAHYYSRYEFEVSQRVPKVIMSRHQRRCCVSGCSAKGPRVAAAELRPSPLSPREATVWPASRIPIITTAPPARPAHPQAQRQEWHLEGTLPVSGSGVTLGVPLSGRQTAPSTDGRCPSQHWHQ